MSFFDGISYNTEYRGLLNLNSSLSSTLIKTEKITDYYHVEQTPFARWVLNFIFNYEIINACIFS